MYAEIYDNDCCLVFLNEDFFPEVRGDEQNDFCFELQEAKRKRYFKKVNFFIKFITFENM